MKRVEDLKDGAACPALQSALQGTVMPCNDGSCVMDKHKGRCVWISPTFVCHADDLLLLHCTAGQELTMHPTQVQADFVFDLSGTMKWGAVHVFVLIWERSR